MAIHGFMRKKVLPSLLNQKVEKAGKKNFLTITMKKEYDSLISFFNALRK